MSASSPALTDAGKTAGDELIAALKEDAKNIKEDDKDDREGINRKYALKQLIVQFQSALASNNTRMIEQMFEGRVGPLTSDKTNQCFAKLVEALKVERDQKAEARAKELEDLVKRAKDKVLQAKSPGELDGMLAELAKKQSRDYDYENGQPNPRLGELRQQLPQIKQFVTEWQNYLQAMHSGDTGAALKTLNTLSSIEVGFIPRSQILERQEQIKPKEASLGDIIAGIKNLDGIKDALNALFEYHQGTHFADSSNSDTYELIKNLNNMEKIYREFLAGLPVNLEIIGRTNDSSGRAGNASLVKLKAELIALVLPRYLGAPEDTHAKPGETVQQLIDRMTTEAKANGDVKLCERIRETQQIFTRGGYYMMRETTGLNDYSAAQNQIGAGQYMLAVVSLQKALKGGNDMLPLQKIGQQLESIQKEHPKEYEAGMKEFLTPANSSYPGGSPLPGMPFSANMDDRMRAQHMRNNGQPDAGEPPIVMPVPGKDNAAPAKTADATPPKSPEKKGQPKPTPLAKPVGE